MSYVIGEEQQDAKLIGVWLLHQHQQDRSRVEVIKVVDAHQRNEYIPIIIFQ
jgi:hypothetical protein